MDGGYVDPQAALQSFQKQQATLSFPPSNRSCPSALPGVGFSQKIRMRMARERRPWVAAFADKALSKAYAASKGVAVPAVLHHARGCEGLPSVEALLREHGGFVMKAAFTAGCVAIVKADGVVVAQKKCFRDEELTGKRMTDASMRRLCEAWMSRGVYTVTEWAYTQLTPAVLIEELLWASAEAGRGPSDVKCFTFQGRVHMVAVVSTQFRHLRRKTDTMVSRAGKVLPLSFNGFPHDPQEPLLQDAALWGRIIHTCEALAAGIDFARVDLLYLPASSGGAGSSSSHTVESRRAAAPWTHSGSMPQPPPSPLRPARTYTAAEGARTRNHTKAQLVFGEITLYPNGGMLSWQPNAEDVDRQLGALWCPPWDQHSPLSLRETLFYDNRNFGLAVRQSLGLA